MNLAEVKQFLADLNNIKPFLPDHLTIENLLPEGGQGVVYKGSVNDSPAAIKIYYPNQIEQRLEREVNALRAIDCPNIVKLLWFGKLIIQNDEYLAMATSLVDGEGLDNRIARSTLSLEEIGRLIYDSTNAIDSLWSKRIVHRDFKPSNIMITKSGRASVIDLGIARHIERTPLTAIGFTFGTYGYMSPEQTRAMRQLTCKSDLFSLAVVVVESVLGRHPTHRDQMRLLSKGYHENLPSELSTWKYADLLMDLFHPRPSKRPTTQQVLSQLEEFNPN